MGKLNKAMFILILFLSFTFLQAQNKGVSVASRVYWPGMWRPEQPWGQYELGYWYNNQFNVAWMTELDHSIAYPYYSGHTLGVNDTARLIVYLDNRSSENFPITTQSPEIWFYPVLYDPYVNVFKSPPLADTSMFEYRFEHWILTVNGRITPQPDTLFSLPDKGYDKRYALVYSLWGIGPGIFRVIIKPTAYKPNNVKLSLDTGNNLMEFKTGQFLQDTLNSYAVIAMNALGHRDMTLFNSYADSIFLRNPQSIIGRALRYLGYAALTDTANALVALDSFLVNLTGRIDPLIPDSSQMTPVHKAWLEQWQVDYSHFKSRMLHPEWWRYKIPL